VASQDPNCAPKNISRQHGAIGLFANRTWRPNKEHAFLVIEGVAKYGQRYLIRSDLYVRDGAVIIQAFQYSPQAFLKDTNNDAKHCRAGLFEQEKIKRVLDKICEFQMQAGFHNYALMSDSESNTVNCISWCIRMLNEATETNLDGWIPSLVVARPLSICNLS
jgi:hypothetical protein